MAAGLPVVATDVGEVRKIVADGETGFVVPAQAPDLLGQALRKALTDPVGARDRGRKGLERVRDGFSERQTALRIDGLYATLLGGRR
jgi:glycosyltransferase involved in cell wall biosynthesis